MGTGITTLMRNDMRKLKINMLKTLLIVFSIAFCFAGFSFSKSYANEVEIRLLNENFAYDSVLVVLDENFSEVNKVHSKDFFGGVEISSIEDLTYTKNLEGEKEKFCQILKLNLVECSRSAVINAIKTISQIQGVKSVEPNYIVTFTKSVDEKNNNTSYNYLWGLFDSSFGINIEQAWDFTTGSKSIRVGIVDSGIYNHCELADNLVQGYDFENLGVETNDDIETHGTKVAGVIGAKANNGMGSPCGINWNVSLVPLQVWVGNSDGQTDNQEDVAFIENVLCAINWAKEQWGTSSQIDILNCSITGYQTTAVRTAIQSFNGLVVFAAGNENVNVDDNLDELATFDLPNLIIVGAIDCIGCRWTTSDISKGSNYSTSGNNVHIYAPGAGIFTTSLDTRTSGDYAETVSGTSFAAPHVAGVAALLLSLNPNLTVIQLKNTILNSAKTHTTTLPNGQNQTIKLLDAYGAVKYVMANHYKEEMFVYNTKTYHKSLNSSSTENDNKIALVKLHIVEDRQESIYITSSSTLKAKLYNSAFEIEVDCSVPMTNIPIKNSLSSGVYYLVVELANANTQANITVTATGPNHTHTSLWMYYSRSQHRLNCVYGETIYDVHSVLHSEIVNNTARCTGCNALLDLSIDYAEIIRSSYIRKITLNGSYILPSGIVVLKDEDVEAYLAGTLVFYNENELPAYA